MHDNVRFSSYKTITKINQSFMPENLPEKIKFNGKPGTYYVRIYSINGTYDPVENYKISIDVKYDIKNESIKDLRFNKGAKGAIWVSDFNPFGYKPLETFERKDVGFTFREYSGQNPYESENYNNPFFGYMSNNYNEHSIFYLWDEEWRKEFYSFLNVFERELNQVVENNIKLRMTLELSIDIIDGFSSVVGVILSMFQLPTKNSIILSFTGTVLPLIISSIFKVVFPRAWDTSKEALLSHIRLIKTAFERTLNPENNEAIKIVSSYKIEVETPPFLPQFNYFCNFQPQFDYIGYSTMDDVISSKPLRSFVHGRTYGIRNIGDISKILNGESIILQDINTGGEKEIFLDDTSVTTQYLRPGEYHWYKFISPKYAEYEFYSVGSTNTYIEFFENIVPGQSKLGMLYYNDDNSPSLNYSKNITLKKGEIIYFRVRGFEWKDVGSYIPFVKSTKILNNIDSINPAEHNFDNEYFFVERKKTIKTNLGDNIITNRLRCGYIKHEGKKYLTLSAKRRNAGVAFIEYNFNCEILKIDYYLALWSSKESLVLNSSIRLEALDSEGKWVLQKVFLPKFMSKDKNNLIKYETSFSFPTRAFRFIIKTNQVNNKNNRGRMVIGRIDLIKNE